MSIAAVASLTLTTQGNASGFLKFHMSFQAHDIAQERNSPYEVRIIWNRRNLLPKAVLGLLYIKSGNQRRDDQPYLLVSEELSYTYPAAKAKDEIPRIDFLGTLLS